MTSERPPAAPDWPGLSRRRRMILGTVAALALGVLVLFLLLVSGMLGEGDAPSEATPGGPGAIGLPAGVRGVGVAAAGRIWLSTRAGPAARGLRATSVEISPDGERAVAGRGSSLVALSSGGGVAWSLDTSGPVAAAAWAPQGGPIAYVVRRGTGHDLRLVDPDGGDDRLVDDDVLPSRPSWRADGRELAWLDAGDGARSAAYPALDDVRITRIPGFRPTLVTFAPDGRRLVFAGTRNSGIGVVLRGGRLRPVPLGGPGFAPSSLAWESGGALILTGGRPGARPWLWRLLAAGSLVGTEPVNAARLAGARSVAVRPGAAMVAAVSRGRSTQIRVARGTPPGADLSFRPSRVIATLPVRGAATVTVR